MLLPLEMTSNERFSQLANAQQDNVLKHFAWKICGHQKQAPLTDEQVSHVRPHQLHGGSGHVRPQQLHGGSGTSGPSLRNTLHTAAAAAAAATWKACCTSDVLMARTALHAAAWLLLLTSADQC